EAVVYGVPEERLGEAVAATVVCHKGQYVTEDELREYVASRLAKYKVPAHIEVQNEPLPRLASGKFDIRALKTRAAGVGAASELPRTARCVWPTRTLYVRAWTRASKRTGRNAPLYKLVVGCDTHRVQSLPPAPVGQLIAGRYVVEAALGRGGMARVYRV